MSYVGMSINLLFPRNLVIILLLPIIVAGLLLSSEVSASSSDLQDNNLMEEVSPEDKDVGSSEAKANLPYLFAVFMITWAGFFGYVFVMTRRRRELLREIESLKTILTDNTVLPK